MTLKLSGHTWYCTYIPGCSVTYAWRKPPDGPLASSTLSLTCSATAQAFLSKALAFSSSTSVDVRFWISSTDSPSKALKMSHHQLMHHLEQKYNWLEKCWHFQNNIQVQNVYINVQYFINNVPYWPGYKIWIMDSVLKPCKVNHINEQELKSVSWYNVFLCKSFVFSHTNEHLLHPLWVFFSIVINTFNFVFCFLVLFLFCFFFLFFFWGGVVLFCFGFFLVF